MSTTTDSYSDYSTTATDTGYDSYTEGDTTATETDSTATGRDSKGGSDTEQEGSTTTTTTTGIDSKQRDVFTADASGQVVKLDKDEPLYGLALSWDSPDPAVALDLDLQAAAYDHNGKQVALCNYNNRIVFDGTFRLDGDNRTGEGEGDDETIKLHLSRIPREVFAVFCFVASYEAGKLDSAINTEATLTNLSTSQTMFHMNITGQSASKDNTALVFCCFQRQLQDPLAWELVALNKSFKEPDWATLSGNLTEHVLAQERPVLPALSALDFTRGIALSTSDASFSGRCLSQAERLLIRDSLYTLQTEKRLFTVDFWGKIRAHKNDYYIASTYTCAYEITKLYYYSIDGGYTFKELPHVDTWITQACLSLSNTLPLKGKPGYTYRLPKVRVVKPVSYTDNEDGGSEGEESAAEDSELEPEESESEGEESDSDEEGLDSSQVEEEEEEKRSIFPGKIRTLYEDQRLAFLVQRIDELTAVVPRGVFVLAPSGDIKKTSKAQFWQGLTSVQLSNLDTYLFFKNPEEEETFHSITNNNVTDNAYFLDPVSTYKQDQVTGFWTLHTDSIKSSTTLRHLYVPGYEFRLDITTKTYGGAYFGDGITLNETAAYMM
jgi:stress response protein SCP2